MWHAIEGAITYLLNPKVSPREARSRVAVCAGCEHLTWAAMPFTSRVAGYCGTPLKEGDAGTCGCLTTYGTKGELKAWREGVHLTIDGKPTGFPHAAGKTTVAGERCPLAKW
jgi:hypothetical protein